MLLFQKPGVRVVVVMPFTLRNKGAEGVLTRRRRLGVQAVRLPAEHVGHGVNAEDLTTRNESQICILYANTHGQTSRPGVQ